LTIKYTERSLGIEKKAQISNTKILKSVAVLSKLKIKGPQIFLSEVIEMVLIQLSKPV